LGFQAVVVDLILSTLQQEHPPEWGVFHGSAWHNPPKPYVVEHKIVLETNKPG